MIYYEKLPLYLKSIKQKIDCLLEFNHSRWLNQYAEFNIQNRIKIRFKLKTKE